jgi:mono/diheme cytochrome c family protein
MPAFGLSDGGSLKVREINAIIAYILAWEKLDDQPALPEVLFIPPTPDPASLLMIPLPEIPPVQGQPDLGLQIYSVHCSACHGVHGQGGVGPRLAKDWASVRADLTIRSTIRQGVPGSLMIAWSQAGGGPLTDEQINHLVALILAWSAVATVPPMAEMASATTTMPGILLAFILLTALTVGVSRAKSIARNKIKI